MALRYYDKYTRKAIYTVVQSALQQDGAAPASITGTSGYSTSPEINRFTLTPWPGTTYNKADGDSPTFYYNPNSLTLPYVDTNTAVMRQGSYSASGVLTYQEYNKALSHYERGTYIETIIAEDFTYPTDGIEGTIWYVRAGEAIPPQVIAPNGGELWNGTHEISWSAPRTDMLYDVELSLNNGSTWSRIGSNVSSTSLQHSFADVQETSLARIRVRGVLNGTYSGWDLSDGIFTVQHNFAPDQPSNLTPRNGASVDRTDVMMVSWQHNDVNAGDDQSKAEVQNRPQGSSVWETEIKETRSESHYYNSYKFAPGPIEWRVRTYDQSGLVSPWSNTEVFLAADPTSAPTILRPGPIVNEARPVIEWSATEQTAYQIIIQDSTNVVIWHSGEVQGTVKARTPGIDLENGGTYTVGVRVKDVGGIFSPYSYFTFDVSFIRPATPSLTVENNGHYVSLLINNPEPVEGEPLLTGNEIYRRGEGSLNWVRIATGLNDLYEDYAVASGKRYEYTVRANGDNGTFSESDIGVAEIKLMGVYIHSVQDPAMTLHHYKFDGSGRSSNKQVEHIFRRFAGRTKQTVEFGEAIDFGVSVSIQILRESDGAERLEQFVENMETICYRDGRGRLLFGVITAAPLEDVTYGWETTINVTEIDYSEEV